MSAHLVINPNGEAQRVLKDATLSIRSDSIIVYSYFYNFLHRQKFNLEETTLQLENKQPEMDNCAKWQTLKE